MKKFTFILLFTFLACSYSRAQEFIGKDMLKVTEISADKDYGTAESKSIKVGRIENQKYYFNALLGPYGEQLKYKRLESCCEYKSKKAPLGKGFLDVYEVWYDGLNTPIKLYLNGYEYETPLCPAGFTLKKTAEVSGAKSFKPLLTDSLFCEKSNTYAVEDLLLKSRLGEFTKPATNPKYSGGIPELRKFFANKKLIDARAAGRVFRVAIGFVVNCKGEAGNFQVISEGKGDLSEMADEVLKMAMSIPGKWEPAMSGSQNVDAYQILSFTIMNGALDKVSYRE
jgi:hypothetical protein